MLLSPRVRLPDVVYSLSRCFSLAFILQSLIFIAGPVGNCQMMASTLGWSFAIAMPLNSLLFFFRVQAVFHMSPGIVILFAILWVCTLASISTPFGIHHAIHVGTTNVCVQTDIKKWAMAGNAVIAVHDTLVYLAISIRLTLNNLPHSSYFVKDVLKIFFSGKGIGQISKTLLTTGQLYYFVTIGVNIITMAIIFSPSVPPVIQAVPPICNIALQNAIACRVYRQLKLGLISESSTPSFYISSPPPSHNHRGGPLSSVQFKSPTCGSKAAGVNTGMLDSSISVDDLVQRPELVKLSGSGVKSLGSESRLDEEMKMKGLGSSV